MYVAEARIHRNVNGCFMGNRFVRLQVSNGVHNNRLLMKEISLTNIGFGEKNEGKKNVGNFNRQGKGLVSEQSPLMLELLQILIKKDVDGKGGINVVSRQKLDRLLEVVIRHCDQRCKTKGIHKILYLTLKYLGMRIGNRSKNVGQIQRVRLLEWLSDAQNLYLDELMKVPVVFMNDQMGPSKRSVRDKALRLKNAVLQGNGNKGGNENKTILENYFSNVVSIGKQNKYVFLMEMLQNYELQILVANLQYVSQEITKLFMDGVEIERERKDDIEELGRALSEKIEFCVELILKRLYLQQWTNVFGQGGRSGESMDRKNKKMKGIEKRNRFSQNMLHKQFMSYSKSVKNEKILGRERLSNIVFEVLKQSRVKGGNIFYEQFTELNKVLKMMVSILLGNGEALQRYCLNNIYGYLKLRMFYGNQDVDRSCQDYGEIIKKYLCRVNGGDGRYLQQNLELFEEHKYLLKLITNPQGSRQELLYFHNIYQWSLSIFNGCQFYAHLLGTIWFHCGLVYPQLLIFDSEYEQNIMRELIVSSSEVQRLGNMDIVHDRYQIENQDSFENENSGILDVGNEQIGEVLRGQGSVEQELGADRVISMDRKQDSQIRQIQDGQFLDIKLFLCVVSYSKMIRECKRVKQLNLRRQIEGVGRERERQRQGENGYLHYQLVDRLILQKLVYGEIRSYNELNRLLVLVRYGCQIGVGELIENYVGNLVKINLGRGDVLVDKFGLQLMVLEMKVSFWVLGYRDVNREIYDDYYGENGELYFYNTFSFRLFENGYLTNCTLENKFNYDLLEKVRELTGVGSQLRILSKEAADEFKRFWDIYFEMENLTERGKLQYRKSVCQQKNGQQNVRNGKNFEKVQKRNEQTEKLKINKLEELLNRIETIIILASNNDLDGCGQVLRVAWEILEDYQDISQECNRQVQVSSLRQSLLEQAGDRLANFVGELRGYLEMMQNQGVSSEQFRRFKKMIF